jgi:hypothetical protein
MKKSILLASAGVTLQLAALALVNPAIAQPKHRGRDPLIAKAYSHPTTGKRKAQWKAELNRR